MNYLKQNHLSILIIAFLVVSAVLPAFAPATFGALDATTIGNPFRFNNSVRIGSSGTAQVNQVATTCSIISNASAAATSSVYGYCTGVTGVTSADTVVATFATSTTLITDQWIIKSTWASSTAGAIDFVIVNLTGQARAFSAASVIGSSTVIKASH